MTPEEAAEKLRLYERRMWEHAVRAAPHNRIGRRLFRWAWRRKMFPPYPGMTPGRIMLLMRVIELRNIRAGGPVRRMYQDLARRYEARPAVPDCRGSGAPGDRFPL